MENLNAEQIRYKMSEKQIKTALMCLSKPNSTPADREKCYFMWKEPSCLSCYHEVAQNALALITSQEQRIKELTEENERLRADKNYWKNRAKESESEYNQAVKRGYNLGAIDYVGSFAERLKAEKITIQDHTGKLGSVVLVGTIDQIAKEMLEGEK